MAEPTIPAELADIFTAQGLDIAKVRHELGLTQGELARLVGFSPRAIQSCEQGWRHPSATLEKLILLLLMAHRNGGAMRPFRCWEVNDCSDERCRNCITRRSGEGHLCWFLSGTLCGPGGQPDGEWLQKRPTCLKCRLFQLLLAKAPPS